MNFLAIFLSKYSAYIMVIILSSIGLVFFLSVMKKDNLKNDSKEVTIYFLINQLSTVAIYLITKALLSVFHIYPGEDTEIILFIFLNFLCIYIETVVFYKLNERVSYSSKNKDAGSRDYQKEIFSSVRDFCLLLVLILVPLYVFGNGSLNSFILFVFLDILVVFFTHTVLLPLVLKKYLKLSK